jgi:fructokinase
MIVSAGEALIDLLPTLDASGQPTFRAAVGGSPLNVAVALARLGIRTAFLGAVSTDAFGDRIMAALAEPGADRSLVSRVDRPTPLAIVALHGAEPRYAFYDNGTAARGMTPRELKSLPPQASILHFGSIALAAEPAASTLLARAKASRVDRIISVDPNVRPALVSEAVGYRRNLEHAMDLAHLLKLSLPDLAWLRPGLAPQDFARERLAAGASLVVVTRGPGGAVAFAQSGVTEVAGLSVAVRDTIGAGDAFTAGLLAGVQEAGVRTQDDLARATDKGMAQALALANTVAALTCTRAGADPPRREELEQLRSCISPV